MMRNPLAAWRAGVRWPLATLGVVATLAAAVLACEAMGWPFLVSPVQRWLAGTLDRRSSSTTRRAAPAACASGCCAV